MRETLQPQPLEARLPDNWWIAAPDVNPALIAGGPTMVVRESDTVIVYIEGDGRAWRTRHSASADPTPLKPVALMLAMGHPGSGRTLYLGRPCQYEAAELPECNRELWTGSRYGRSTVSAMSAALDQLASPYEQLILIGFSGGGVMAALLAAQRPDVAGFITIAANLDIALWTEHHGVSPLAGSMSPMSEIQRLGKIPQVHLVGTRDQTVPPMITRSYLDSLPAEATSVTQLIVVPDFDHRCCWADDWRTLGNEALTLLQEQIHNSAVAGS